MRNDQMLSLLLRICLAPRGMCEIAFFPHHQTARSAQWIQVVNPGLPFGFYPLKARTPHCIGSRHVFQEDATYEPDNLSTRCSFWRRENDMWPSLCYAPCRCVRSGHVNRSVSYKHRSWLRTEFWIAVYCSVHNNNPIYWIFLILAIQYTQNPYIG
jgi:hypothetical protein